MNVICPLGWIAAASLLCSPGGGHGFGEGPPNAYATEVQGATFASLSDASSSKPSPPGAITFVSFKPEDFPFVTTIKDDGKR